MNHISEVSSNTTQFTQADFQKLVDYVSIFIDIDQKNINNFHAQNGEQNEQA